MTSPVQRAIRAARGYWMWVIWMFYHNRRDLRNPGAPTLSSFKHDPRQKGIGEELEHGPVLTERLWGAHGGRASAADARRRCARGKVRMSGFYGTHLDQVLRTQGISTLFRAGVNIDQCVSTTMEDAYLRDYNAVLLSDACATSSPSYCNAAVDFNAKQCWGFVTDTAKFASAEPFEG